MLYCRISVALGLIKKYQIGGERMNKYIISVRNTANGKYENVEVSEEVYTAYMRTGWNIKELRKWISCWKYGETLWNNKFPVSKPLFDTVKASGFDTVRIPVSYMDKIGNEVSGYKIEEAWLNRVQESSRFRNKCRIACSYWYSSWRKWRSTEKWIDISSDDFETVQTKFTAVYGHI